MPGTNPLRSLGELAGKIPPDYRITAMELVRDAVRRELEQRGIAVSLPEQRDARLSVFPFGAASAAEGARGAKLSGHLLLGEIRRWDADSPGLLRVRVEFKLVRIDDGEAIWERGVQRLFSGTGARLDQASMDAARKIAEELFLQ
jgi:hypothetical protein